jgi:hypothetical protein
MENDPLFSDLPHDKISSTSVPSFSSKGMKGLI